MAHPRFTANVTVRPLPEQTDAAQQLYGFAYTITIRNSGDVAAQVIARHWLIHDHRGGVQEVRGLGVVGHQPSSSPVNNSNTPAGRRSPRRKARCRAPCLV